jgi:hypothetical protein
MPTFTCNCYKLTLIPSFEKDLFDVEICAGVFMAVLLAYHNVFAIISKIVKLSHLLFRASSLFKSCVKFAYRLLYIAVRCSLEFSTVCEVSQLLFLCDKSRPFSQTSTLSSSE